MKIRHYLEFKSFDKIVLSGYYAWSLLSIFVFIILYTIWFIAISIFNIIYAFFLKM